VAGDGGGDYWWWPVIEKERKKKMKENGGEVKRERKKKYKVTLQVYCMIVSIVVSKIVGITLLFNILLAKQ
jgi:hypothetical protein